MVTKRHSRLWTILLASLLVPAGLFAQQLPQQDSGIDGLLQTLGRLGTTARVMQITAHPDDDDGAMLAYVSRGQGATVLMQQMNRGEGGQNRFGSELFDELGILRTLELTEADRYYAVQQRFTRVVDFGFSKTAKETFQKWGGHDPALSDIVRVIRTFRPDVIVAHFQGTPKDGHGNHQAAGILAREAFRAAADPNRFPEQIKEGLLPWQAKKLYTDNVKKEEATVTLDVGNYSPVLGMSYSQIAMEGLKHQQSQGVGGWINPPGHQDRYYKLVDTVLADPAKTEKSFLDGLDTTLPGLASRLGAEESKAPFLRPALQKLQQEVAQAAAAFNPTDPSASAPPLLAGLEQVNSLLAQVKESQLSPEAKQDLAVELGTKQRQFRHAANLALGTVLEVGVDPEPPKNAQGAQNLPPAAAFFRREETFQTAVPGQTFTLTARLYNRSPRTVVPGEIELNTPPGWQVSKVKSELKPLNAGEGGSVQFRVTVPHDAAYTRPYWHRNSEEDPLYIIDDPRYATLPFPPYPVSATATYKVDGKEGAIGAIAQVKFVDPMYGQDEKPLVVGPPASVEVDSPVQVYSTRAHSSSEVRVGVRNDTTAPLQGALRLEAPEGWKVEPASQPVNLEKNGFGALKFTVTPRDVQEKTYVLKATLESQGKTYGEGFRTIGRQDVGWFNYYRPAQEEVSAVDVAVPRGLKVGYLMGAGDDIPQVLRDIGVNLTLITPDQLANGDLSQFGTIILGIRAYDVRSDVRQYNFRLLNYVKDGGTLIVQYNHDASVFNAGNYTPYPATSDTNLRITEEDAPVEILAPQNPIFHYPNAITQRDFAGWVQERGTYFMSKWDPHFTPLLASGDTGEKPLPGGLLEAQYGKGKYIYSGYAFFRQVPAGVPGAIRLLVNLLSAGHEEETTASR